MDDNIVIVLPPGITPEPGDRVRLSNLDTDTPLLEIGARKLHGQHQRLIGTTAIFSKPTITASSADSSSSLLKEASLRDSIRGSGDGASDGRGIGGGNSDGFIGLQGGRRIVFKMLNDPSLQDTSNREIIVDSPRGRGRGRGRGISSTR